MSEQIEPKFNPKELHLPYQKSSQSGPKTITFTGSAGDYFGIWIVNVILSIVTIGIYSAWAKVKRETFFKNNTLVGETGFGYHATGIQIFKGRLIAFFILVGINIVAAFFPIISVAIFVILIFLIPLIINNALRFSARVTSFRNIRFNWHGTYWKSFWFFVIAPLISILSLGTLMPLISKAYYTYFARSHSYGKSNFSCEPRVKDYYFAFGVGVILPMLFVFIAFSIVIGTLGAFTFPVLDNGGDFGSTAGSVVPLILIFAVALGASVYRILCRNLMMRSLALHDVAIFGSEINPIRYVWINVSNIILIILSVGLLIPWATVRAYKYLSNCSKIKITGDLEKFIDEARDNKSSFGEELAEMEGIEVTI